MGKYVYKKGAAAGGSASPKKVYRSTARRAASGADSPRRAAPAAPPKAPVPPPQPRTPQKPAPPKAAPTAASGAAPKAAPRATSGAAPKAVPRAASGASPKPAPAKPAAAAPRRVVRRSKKRRLSGGEFFVRFLLGLALALLLIFALVRLIDHRLGLAAAGPEDAVSAPVAQSVAAPTAAPAQSEAQEPAEPTPVPTIAPIVVADTLAEQIAQAAESDLSPWPALVQAIAACDDVGFLAIDLETRQTLAYQPDLKMDLASAIKAPFALYAYRCLDAGLFSDEDLRVYTEEFYDEGSGDIQDSEFGSTYPLAYLLQESLRCSDNIAYRMAADAFGSEGFNEMVWELGATTLAFTPSIWPDGTPRDCAKAWNAILAYIEGDAPHAATMKSILTGNRYSPIRKALEYQKTVASKYGWFEPTFADCGIVYDTQGVPQYLLCILTSNAVLEEPYETTAPVIQEIDNIMNEIHQGG